MIANANEYNLDLTKFGRIDTRDGGCKPSGTQGSGRESYDDINWLQAAASAEGTIDGAIPQTDNPYVQMAKSRLQMVLSYLGKQSEQKARQTADTTNSNIKTLETEQATIKKDVDTRIEAINSLIQANQETINNLIQSLEETQAEIQEENTKKEELAGNIADAQQRYADAQTDEEKEEILEELTGYNEELIGIIGSLTAKVEEAGTTQGNITTVQEDIAPLEGDIENVKNDGNSRIDASGQKIVAQQNTNKATGTLAGVEEGVSKTAGMLALEFEATANGSSAIPVFGSAASAAAQETARKCRDVESDTDGSSRVYFQMLQQTGPMLANLVGGNNTINSSISSFVPTALGGYNDVNTYVDLAFNTVNPIIESIGSVQEAEETSEDFGSVIEEECSRISTEETPEGEEPKDETDSDDNTVVNFDLSALEQRLFA